MANGKSDIRLHTGWPRHHKTRRLKRLLGAEGPLALLSLWCYAGEHKTDGNLGALSIEEIEEIAEWDGKPGALHEALVKCRWLEPDGKLHDWRDEQPWLSQSLERQEVARAAANARWEADRMRRACVEHAVPENSNAPLLSSPLLSDPKKKKKNRTKPPAGAVGVGVGSGVDGFSNSDPKPAPAPDTQEAHGPEPAEKPLAEVPKKLSIDERLDLAVKYSVDLWNRTRLEIMAEGGKAWTRSRGTVSDQTRSRIRKMLAKNDNLKQDIDDAMLYVRNTAFWTDPEEKWQPNIDSFFIARAWITKIDGGASMRPSVDAKSLEAEKLQAEIDAGLANYMKTKDSIPTVNGNATSKGMVVPENVMSVNQ